MALLPKVKLTALVSFPATVRDGVGIDVVRQNGSYQFNIDFGDFNPVTTLTDPNHQYALVWNNLTGIYDLVTAAALGAGVNPSVALPLVESGAGAVGTSLSYAREDHVHPAFGGGGGTPSNANPAMDGTAAPGVATPYSRGDHVHPTDTTRVAKSGDTMTGNLSINAGSPVLYINKTAATQDAGVYGATNGNARWFVDVANAAAESGGNAGSNFLLHRYADDGSYLGSPFNILRATGVVSFTLSPTAPTPTAGDNSTKLATTAFVQSFGNPLSGLAGSGVGTITEFSGGQISTQGVLNNSFSIYATPTALANSTVFSASADQTNLAGAGTSTVANFGAITGAAQSNYTRVNSTFLEDHSTNATQHVALYAGARKFAGAANQTTFAANIQVMDNNLAGSGVGNVVGMEISVDGNQQTNTNALGLGIYARGNDAVSGSFTFTGGNALLIDSYSQVNAGGTGFAQWTTGIRLTGRYTGEGIATWGMAASPSSPFALHMGNAQRVAWDGGTPGSVRSWIVWNNAITAFEFWIDGARRGYIDSAGFHVG